MNGINDDSEKSEGREATGAKPAAFCQNCGKALDHETKRIVGTSVYCEPCLAARLAGKAAFSGGGQGYGPVNYVAGMPIPTGEPNPGLAALLGLIPGVGAMYNEQYAKGIVHLAIFALLVSPAHVNGLFGLFIAGWEFYMAIEAHHTAKARRDGTPLPNPFGFNDIGERMGFGRAWPAGPDAAGVARDGAAAAAAGFGSVHQGFRPGRAATAAPPPPSSVGADPAAAAGGSWGAPVDAYPSAQAYGATAAGPGYAQGSPAAYGAGYPYAPPVQAPYGAPFPTPVGYPPLTPPLPPLQNRFPVGAIWLIGVGSFFLLGTTGIFHHVSPGIFVGLLLIAFGIWVFLRLMTETGQGLSSDGTPGYRFRLVRALKPSVWLILFGSLTLLNDLHILRWEYSWPWIIILAGVMMLLTRAAYNSAAAAMYGTTPARETVPQSYHAESAINPAEHKDQNTSGGGK